MNAKQTIIQNILHPGNSRVIHAVQGDRNSRQIKLLLFEGLSVWTIPEGTDAVIRYQRADGIQGEYALLPDGSCATAMEGNAITVTLAPQLLEVPGEAQLSVVLTQGDHQLSSFAMTVQVAEDPTAQIAADTVEITANGTFDVAPYTTACIAVPEPEGTVILTENGTCDVRAYEQAQVQVPIPEGYLLPEGSLDIAQNGEYQVGALKCVRVNVVTQYPIAEEAEF